MSMPIAWRAAAGTIATVLVTVAVLAAACPCAAAQAEDETPPQGQTLVLRDGDTLQVDSAEVKGSFVHLQLPDGRLQAYPIEDVDLAASGLLPEATDPDAQLPVERRRHESMLEARSRDDTESVLTITDDDVDHVAPPDLSAEAGLPETEGSVELVVSNVRKQFQGGALKVSGNVENKSEVVVEQIAVEARALDREGSRTGQGRVRLEGQLGPGQRTGFEVSFPVNGATVSVEATAIGMQQGFTPTKDVTGKRPKPPPPGDGTRPQNPPQRPPQLPPQLQQLPPLPTPPPETPNQPGGAGTKEASGSVSTPSR